MRDNRSMPDQNGTLRVGVVGAGAFGRNHARVYRELAADASQSRRIRRRRRYRLRARAEPSLLNSKPAPSVPPPSLSLRDVDAVSVAVPTVLHLAVARELMQSGVDVLIEKPLAASVAEADELITAGRSATAASRRSGTWSDSIPRCARPFRCSPQPMFFEVHRLSVFTPRSLDVDVVLDLMIHDIDIVLAFAKSKVKEIRAVGLPILSKKVDIANVRMEFESGCVANFTASRVSTERVRKLRFFQPRQYVSLDYSRQDVLVLTVDDEAPEPLGLDPFNPASVAASAFPGITPFKPKVEQQEPLKAEIVSFLDAVRRRSQPEVTLERATLAAQSWTPRA